MALVSSKYLFVANIGDSRAILVKKKDGMATNSNNNEPCWEPSNFEVIAMSEDHKPHLLEEWIRIKFSVLKARTDYVYDK